MDTIPAPDTTDYALARIKRLAKLLGEAITLINLQSRTINGLTASIADLNARVATLEARHADQ